MRRRVLPAPCVLCRSAVRSCLLRLADLEFFELRWSSWTIDETRRKILDLSPTLDPRGLDWVIAEMRDACPGADVLDHEARLETIPSWVEDYHLLAAARAGRVDAIVVIDRKRISAEACAELGISVVTLDNLLCWCWERNEHAVMQAFIEQAVERSYSLEQMFERLVRDFGGWAPNFVEQVLQTYAPHQSRSVRPSARRRGSAY
jgi:hypothetical protein